MATVPISDGDPKDTYTATGGQTTFQYTFWIKEEDHLAVYVNGVLQALTTDYTISAVQSVTGANVVFNSGLTASDSVVIVYDPDFERTAEYTGTIRLDALNVELTYLLTLLQSNQRKIDDALRPADSNATAFDGTLPTPTASRLLKFNATADGLALGPTETEIANAEANATAAAASASAASTSETNASTSASAAAASAALLPQNNFSATTNPAATDDSGEGYSVGSRWVNVTSDESYICVDDTVDAAVWLNSTLTLDELGTLAVNDDVTFALLNSSLVADEDDMSSDSATKIPTQQSVKAYVDNNAGAWTYATEQATTSGTSVLFSSLPSGLTEIEVLFKEVSSNSGSSEFELVLGTSGGLETTDIYAGTSWGGATANSISGASHSTKFNVYYSAGYIASRDLHGVCRLVKGDDDVWYLSGNIVGDGAIVGYASSGSVDLGATLDRVQFQISTGTLNGGTINIRYR